MDNNNKIRQIKNDDNLKKCPLCGSIRINSTKHLIWICRAIPRNTTPSFKGLEKKETLKFLEKIQKKLDEL